MGKWDNFVDKALGASMLLAMLVLIGILSAIAVHVVRTIPD